MTSQSIAERITIEADTVEQALTFLSEELGTSARILSVDRLRRGGIAGFFAREVVQLVAEGPETTRDSAGESPEGVASAFERLLAEASEDEAERRFRERLARAPEVRGPVGRSGVVWSTARLEASGLPDAVTRAVAGLAADDDIGHVTALSAELASVCGPIPTGPQHVIGERRDRLLAATEIEEGDGPLHVVVDGALPESLPGAPRLVSWVSDDGAGRAIALAVGSGATLAYAMSSAFGSPVRRVSPLDAALAVRELMERT